MKVAITYDFLRNTSNGLAPVVANARWLAEVVRTALASDGDHEVKLVAAGEDGGFLDSHGIMRKLGLSQSPSGWARSVGMADLAAAEVELTALLDCDIVVGFGLTPGLLRLLDTHGVRFVDFEIAPQRLCPSLFLHVRTNSAAHAAAVHQFAVDSAIIEAGVARLAARQQCISRPFRRNERVVAYFGQVHIDLALVADGMIRSVNEDYLFSKVKEIAGRYDSLLVCPHPFVGSDLSNIDRLLTEIGNAKLTPVPAYAALVSSGATEAIALSSSVITEAKLFGRRATQLIVPDRDRSDLLPTIARDWFVAEERLVTPSGMRRLLLGREVPVPRDEGLLRYVLGYHAPESENYQIADVPKIPESKVLPLSSDSSVTAVLKFGWHQPETWGTWTRDEWAVLAFRTALQGPVEVNLNGMVFSPTGDFRQAVEVKPLGAHRFTPMPPIAPDGLLDWRIEVMPTAEGLVHLTFRIREPLSPQQLGISADPRSLGLGLRTLEVTSRVSDGAAPPVAPGADHYQHLHQENAGYQGNNWLTPYASQVRALGLGKIVECGCGNGRFIRAVSSAETEAIGLDWSVSPRFPHSARNVAWQKWNAEFDSVPQADLVCSADFLEHISRDWIDDLLGRLHSSGQRNLHVIACYDDWHSHQIVEPPQWWLQRFVRLSPDYRIIGHIDRDPLRPVCVIANFAFATSDNS